MSNEGWHIKAIKADKAWEKLTDPATGQIDYGDVRIGHIDTGYTEHPVFGFEPGETTNLIHDHWTNFIERDSQFAKDPMDYDGNKGHGTRIGSVIYGDQEGVMRGVAPRCPAVPYRATNHVVLSKLLNEHVPAIGKAIRHAVDDSDCDVISMSLGTPWSPAKNMRRAVDYAYENGVIIVAASGNNVSDHTTYPGKFYRTICAGGLTPDLTVWREHAEHNRQYIDVLAPAEEIFRAEPMEEVDLAALEEEYKDNGSGTSYATACTAGAAALWLAHRSRDIDDLYSEPWMTIEAFRALLKRTSTPLRNPPPYMRAGILNIEALLDADLPEEGALKKEDRLSTNMKY